jgi:hypothetical protein
MTAVIGRLGVVLMAAAVVVLSGCGADEVDARSLTHDRAVKLFNAMETYPGSTPLDQANEAKRYGDVKVWVAKDTDDGREIVLAVTVKRSDTWGQPLPSVTDCYRWTDDREWDTADHVDCPTTVDIPDVPEPPATPVPDGADHRIERALAGRSTVEQVRARLAGLPNLDVAEEDGVVYVATGGIAGYFSGHPTHECEVAWRAGGKVMTYWLDRDHAAEGACSADIASEIRSGDL